MKKAELRQLIREEIQKNAIPKKLYHFTLPKYLVNILDTDILEANNKFRQISFTSDPELWAFREFNDEDQEIGVRLTFNSKDLPPLKPFIYKGNPFEDYSYEQEYITTSGDIYDISDKIIDITTLNYYKDYLKDNLSPDMFNKINFVS